MRCCAMLCYEAGADAVGHVAGTSIRDFLSLPAHAKVQMCFDAFGAGAGEVPTAVSTLPRVSSCRPR